MKTKKSERMNCESIWEWIASITVISILIGLASLVFYGMSYGTVHAKTAWIPSLAFAIFVIGILVYDHYHPGGGQL